MLTPAPFAPQMPRTSQKRRRPAREPRVQELCDVAGFQLCRVKICHLTAKQVLDGGLDKKAFTLLRQDPLYLKRVLAELLRGAGRPDPALFTEEFRIFRRVVAAPPPGDELQRLLHEYATHTSISGVLTRLPPGAHSYIAATLRARWPTHNAEWGQICKLVRDNGDADVQESFIGKLPLDWREPLVERMAFLMKVAAALEIPMLATAEDMDHDGPLVPALVEQLPASAPQVFNKMIFGLASQPEILHAVEATGRDTVVLVGLETDVCIAQSALGLQQRGYRVVVVTDATASPPPHHEHGLARLRQAGVTLTSTKGLHYEWMADLATLGQVKVEQYDSFKGGSPMAATRYTL